MRHILRLSLLLLGFGLLACGGNESQSATEPQAVTTAPATLFVPPIDSQATATDSVSLPVPELTESPALSPTITQTIQAELPPTVTPEPVDIPINPALNLPVVAADGTLPTSHDLIFIGDGNLRLWASSTGQVTTLLDQADGVVERAASSDDGQRIAIVRRLNDNNNQVELLWIDRATGQQQQLTIATTIVNLSISPNGQWLAYTPRYDESPAGQNVTLSIQLKELTTSAPPAHFAECMQSLPESTAEEVRRLYASNRCGWSLTWTRDSQQLIWSDGRGLNHRAVTANQTYLLHPHDITPTNPIETGFYHPLSWASNERFLLLYVGHWEWSKLAVFDVAAGTLYPIPDYLVSYGPLLNYIDWMHDDRLFMVDQQNYESGISLQTLRLPISGEALLVDEERTLPAGGLTGISLPHHGRDGLFYFVIGSDSPGLSGIYQLTSLSATPELILSLPDFNPQHQPAQINGWTPDASALLWHANPSGTHGDTLWVLCRLVGESGCQDVTSFLGERLTLVQWVLAE